MTSIPDSQSTSDTMPPRRPPLAVLVALPALIAMLAVALFAAPQTDLEPRGMPMGLVGEDTVLAQSNLAVAASGIDLDIHEYASEGEAMAAIRDREVYGALVVNPEQPVLMTASAAGVAVDGLLTELAGRLAGAAAAGGVEAAPLQKVDVVPTPADDPRGAGFVSAVLPILLVGVMTGVLAALLVPGGRTRATFLLASSALAGLAAMLAMQPWLGVLAGSWLANAGVLALLILASSATVAGLASVLGPAGIGVGALLLVFIGNPWSGVATAPELLPSAIGTIGQLLPPGAGISALRGSAFFDGAATLGPLLILTAWAAVGLGLVMAGALRQRRPV